MDERMKILRVVGDIYPDVTGGLEIHAHEMSRMQANCGHEVTVFTSNNNNLPEEEFKDGYRIVRYSRIIKIFGNSISLALLIKLVKNRNNFDIIHAHSHLFLSTNICALIRFIGSSPFIISNHGLMSASAPVWFNTLYLKTLGKWTLTRADKIICYTDGEKENIEKLGIDPKKISVIHNGVDTTLFVPRASEKIADKKQILWVGRHVPGKGVEYLIEAFSLVQKKIPGTHLVLVGVGPEKMAIEDRIRKLHLQSSVTFIDYLDNTELPGIYKNSDVFVLPSLMEGVPRTILEAMACGVPVVTTNLPHLVGIVDGAGLVVPPKDPALLSNAILTILEDASLAEKMGRRGRNRIEREYSWEDTVAKTLTSYESVIANRR
jgi:glycosyltransferase involved in cell wall biosynthesis